MVNSEQIMGELDGGEVAAGTSSGRRVGSSATQVGNKGHRARMVCQKRKGSVRVRDELRYNAGEVGVGLRAGGWGKGRVPEGHEALPDSYREAALRDGVSSVQQVGTRSTSVRGATQVCQRSTTFRRLPPKQAPHHAVPVREGV